MRSLSAAEYPFVALVLLSLTGKVATNTADEPLVSAERTFASAVVRQLSRSGFATTVEHWPTGVVVHAQHGACRMWVRDYSPHGTMRNVHEELANPIGPLRFVYKGAASEEPPKVGPLLRFFLQREMLRLGVSTPKYPIYAVASSPTCDHLSFRLPASIT